MWQVTWTAQKTTMPTQLISLFDEVTDPIDWKTHWSQPILTFAIISAASQGVVINKLAKKGLDGINNQGDIELVGKLFLSLVSKYYI